MKCVCASRYLAFRAQSALHHRRALESPRIRLRLSVLDSAQRSHTVQAFVEQSVAKRSDGIGRSLCSERRRHAAHRQYAGGRAGVPFEHPHDEQVDQVDERDAPKRVTHGQERASRRKRRREDAPATSRPTLRLAWVERPETNRLQSGMPRRRKRPRPGGFGWRSTRSTSRPHAVAARARELGPGAVADRRAESPGRVLGTAGGSWGTGVLGTAGGSCGTGVLGTAGGLLRYGHLHLRTALIDSAASATERGHSRDSS